MSCSKPVYESSDEEDEADFILLAEIVKRRRLSYLQNEAKQGPAGPKTMKTRFDWDTFFEAESPACFRRMFRLSKHSFTKALGYIERFSN